MLFPEKIQKKKKSYEQFPLGFLDKSKQISLSKFRNPKKNEDESQNVERKESVCHQIDKLMAFKDIYFLFIRLWLLLVFL